LHLINHPIDLEFWKTNIANGKAGTLMPAFAASQGGPLNDAQVEDLAKDCLRAMPYIPRSPEELRAGQYHPYIVSPPKAPGTN
jgi:hypothetical protein